MACAPHGVLVINADDPAGTQLAARVRRLRPDVQVVTYGPAHTATVQIESIDRRDWSTKVVVMLPEDVPVVLRLNTPAVHHARNAVAALAALAAVGMDGIDAADAVSQFRGVHRRFTQTGQADGVTVVDCYASHPNEIAADLQAARAVAGEHRVIAVRQPCGYT